MTFDGPDQPLMAQTRPTTLLIKVQISRQVTSPTTSPNQLACQPEYKLWRRKKLSTCLLLWFFIDGIFIDFWLPKKLLTDQLLIKGQISRHVTQKTSQKSAFWQDTKNERNTNFEQQVDGNYSLRIFDFYLLSTKFFTNNNLTMIFFISLSFLMTPTQWNGSDGKSLFEKMTFAFTATNAIFITFALQKIFLLVDRTTNFFVWMLCCFFPVLPLRQTCG